MLLLLMVPDSDKLRQRVGTNIRRARIAAGLTQAELAALIDDPSVDQPTISRWERGGAMPRPESLLALAGALNVGLPSLFEPTDDETNGVKAAVA